MAGSTGAVLDQIRRAGCVGDLGHAVKGVQRRCGTERVAFALELPAVGPDADGVIAGDGVWARRGRIFVFGTYPAVWIDRYFERGYETIDPVCRAAETRAVAFCWDELDWSAPEAAGLLEDARAHGVGPRGVTAPVRGPGGRLGLLSVAAPVEPTPAEARWSLAGDLALIGLALHERALGLLGALPEPSPLTWAQAEALRQLAEGRTRREGAAVLGLTESAFAARVSRARARLGARSATYAVAAALAGGWLG